MLPVVIANKQLYHTISHKQYQLCQSYYRMWIWSHIWWSPGLMVASWSRSS